MAEPITGAEKVRWDLSGLYSGLTDPQLDADFAALKTKAQDFSARYKGKLASALGPALTEYGDICSLLDKLSYYLSLLQSTDVADAAVQAKRAAADREIAALAGEHLTFFELELANLPSADLAQLYAAEPVVEKHKPWIEHLRTFQPFLLSEPVEAALAKRSPFGQAAWSGFYPEVENDLEFGFQGEKKTLAEMLHLLSDLKEPAARAEALRIFNAGLGGGFAKYAAQALYVTAGAGSVEDKERGYKHPMAQRNRVNRIPDEVVDVLHKTVTEVGAPLMARYYHLKAKLLGLPRLAWSDRNAPMPFAAETSIQFEEAARIVQAAYAGVSPTLAGIVDSFFKERRIDAAAVKGKESGAFNASLVLPGGKPDSYTLLNYLGSPRDVMTLAHELGHGVHGILAGAAQGPLMAHAPIAYCETASVFGEMTTFEYLKAQMTAAGGSNVRPLLALLMGKIDDNLNTVLRQIGLSNFERRLHGMDAQYSEWGSVQKFAAEDLDKIWMQTVEELYGAPGDVFTYENMEHIWAYVDHFHRPFYVYGYAFGELLTQGLYAARPHLGAQFEPLYLDLLRSGSTRDVSELLAPFGLDPQNPKFWSDGLATGLGALIDEAEKLAARL